MEHLRCYLIVHTSQLSIHILVADPVLDVKEHLPTNPCSDLFSQGLFHGGYSINVLCLF